MTTIRPSSNRLLGTLLIAILCVLLIVLTKGRAEMPATNAFRTWEKTRAGQLVFFAVLEGLSRDGVSNADVDLIIPPETGGKPKFEREHFVYACPLCHPAFEAFRLYRQRERFFGLKAEVNAFGPGLDAAVSARLRSDDAGQRREAIEILIRRWVAQRMEMMRLSDTEREAITREVEQGRKVGMGSLKQSEKDVPGNARTTCPVCDGSFGACKPMVQ